MNINSENKNSHTESFKQRIAVKTAKFAFGLDKQSISLLLLAPSIVFLLMAGAVALMPRVVIALTVLLLLCFSALFFVLAIKAYVWKKRVNAAYDQFRGNVMVHSVLPNENFQEGESLEQSEAPIDLKKIILH